MALRPFKSPNDFFIEKRQEDKKLASVEDISSQLVTHIHWIGPSYCHTPTFSAAINARDSNHADASKANVSGWMRCSIFICIKHQGAVFFADAVDQCVEFLEVIGHESLADGLPNLISRKTEDFIRVLCRSLERER